jgi:hypothetical protein
MGLYFIHLPIEQYFVNEDVMGIVIKVQFTQTHTCTNWIKNKIMVIKPKDKQKKHTSA